MKKLIAVLLLTFSSLAAQNSFIDKLGGYTDKVSYYPGDTVYVSISIDIPLFELKLYYPQVDLNPIQVIANVVGKIQAVPDSAYWYGCGWDTTLSLVIPPSWKSGVYIGEFSTLTNIKKRVIFIVKNPAMQNDILFVISTNTYQLYNNFGGKSGYDYNSTSGKRCYKMSFQRPYGGLGDGFFTDVPYNRDPNRYAPKSGWEAIAGSWLEKNKYKVDYCSDTDLDSTQNILDRYKVVLIVGHSEYWSIGMRNKAEYFLSQGGKIVILSGNTCWTQVRYENDFHTIVCYKDPVLDPLYHVQDSLVTGRWPYPPLNRYSNKLTGVNWEEGGVVNYVDNNIRILPADSGYGGYVIFNAGHWIFEDTKLLSLDTLGRDNAIVGYETDGYKKIYWNDGFPSGFIGPYRFRILGIHPAMNFDGTRRGYATMGIFFNDNGGATFNGATTNWAHGLVKDRNVQSITKTVLNHFIDNRFPPDIVAFYPNKPKQTYVYKDTLISRQLDYEVHPGDSLMFEIRSEDYNKKRMLTYWTEDGTVVSNRYFYTFKPKEMRHGQLKKVRVYVRNDLDTTSMEVRVRFVVTKIISQPDTVLSTYKTWAYPVSAVNYYGHSLQFRFIEKPDWISYDSTNRLLKGRPSRDDIGKFKVSFQVSDSLGNADTQSVFLKVNFTGFDSTKETDYSLLDKFVLNESYPNPFNGSTSLFFFLKEPATIRAEVYNILGQKILNLHSGKFNEGIHSLRWNGRDGSGNEISSGIYFCRVMATFNDQSRSIRMRKFIFVK